MQISGKTILVTGGTDGIGLQLIRQLKAKGATVITSGRNPERVAAAQAEGFEVIAADLSTYAGIDTLLGGWLISSSTMQALAATMISVKLCLTWPTMTRRSFSILMPRCI
jgi:NAD(P)-dependent dehydrogenase (short-subunit alcohol dehydrogenase family)